MGATGRKYSSGGQAVASSLTEVGFEVNTPGVALVETIRPDARAHTVLVQSAWNVISWGEFRRLLRPYPQRLRVRALARRRLAHLNIRQASRVVCLTRAMADLVAQATGREVIASAVTLPLDTPAAAEPTPRTRVPNEAVVPGTLTWYKRPLAALDWLASQPALGIERVWFCGSDDGSNCLAAVRERATELGYSARMGAVSRAELCHLYARAQVVVLPSELESLGFSVTEALMHNSNVVASPIPAHIEISDRLGVAPVWFPGSLDDVNTAPPIGMLRAEVAAEWERLGEVLGLSRPL